MKLKAIQLAIPAIGCALATSASAGLLVDRGLPTDNLNNAAGANRANVAWAFGGYTAADYWVAGDTFVNNTAQPWAIDTIRMWSITPVTSAVLRGGLEGSSVDVLSTAYTLAGVSYAGGADYQGSSTAFIPMVQIDFAVGITLAPGQTYQYFLDGTGSSVTVPFSHASNAALSGSPQDGADNLMLYAHVVNGNVVLADGGTWNSDAPNTWDKDSDINVQVFGTPVPEPTTVFAGALLLLPFGASVVRKLRKNRAA